MRGALPPLSGRAAERQRLIDAVLSMPQRRFAVIDGAHFADLQRDLILARLEFRPLYLDELDRGGLAAGPHLVALRTAADVEQVVGLAGDKPCAVFWSWPDEGEATIGRIHRHLRSINLVEIPRGADDPDAARKAASHVQDDHDHPLPKWEAVLLRHADPDVMGIVLPVLDRHQQARLAGGARAIVLRPSHGEGPLAFQPPPPKEKLRFLRVTAEQYAMISHGHMDVLKRRAIAEFVAKMAPNAAEPDREVAECFDRAVGYGIREKKDIWDFLELNAKRGRGFERAPDLAEALSDLNDPSLSGGTKLFRLKSELRFLARRMR